MKETIVVSFSGGETSGNMCKWLLDNYGHLYYFVFVFANTGREHEETLIFVDKCDREFGLQLVWIEAVTSPIKGIGTKHKIVNFKTACRDGSVFEDFIKKEGIPNTSRQHCTTRLKTRPIRHWMRQEGLIRCSTAIGMRSDEPNRIISSKKRELLEFLSVNPHVWRLQNRSDRNEQLNELGCGYHGMTKNQIKTFKSLYKHNEYDCIYPMNDWEELDKQDVNTFWESQSFRLNLPSHLGNCTTCFKKSDNKLYRIAHESPEYFRWNLEMDEKYSGVNAGKNDKHVFFRKKRDTKALVGDAMQQDLTRLIFMTTSDRDKSAGCSESCNGFSDEDE